MSFFNNFFFYLEKQELENDKKLLGPAQSKTNLSLNKQESQTPHYASELSYKMNRASLSSKEGLIIDKDVIESGTVRYFTFDQEFLKR